LLELLKKTRQVPSRREVLRNLFWQANFSHISHIRHICISPIQCLANALLESALAIATTCGGADDTHVIPTSCENQVIVANVKEVLHWRVFDVDLLSLGFGRC